MSGLARLILKPGAYIAVPAYSLSMLPGSHLFLHTAQDLLLAEISQELEMQLRSLNIEKLLVQKD